MEPSVRFMDRKYFLRLLTGLLILVLLLQLPFSLFVFHVSQQSVLNNINVSNQTVLEQLHRNYDSYSSNISNLAASIFWRDDIQRILYSPNPSYEDVHFTLRELYTTFVTSHPSLHSIYLYNKNNGELYTVSSIGTIDKQSFQDFLHQQESIRPLQPLLHQAPLQTRDSTARTPMFSYFMYQFSDPSQNNESYLVLNQYADQSISTIDTFSGPSDVTPTATYYVTMETHIASKVLAPEVSASHEQLLDQFRAQKDDLPLSGSCYQDTVDGKEYLLSYIHTREGSASLVIIQDYDQVFAELNSLKTSFYLFFAVFTVAALVLVVLITRFLYKPIDSIFSLVHDARTPIPDSIRRINELDVIKHAYKTASDRNQILERRDDRYRPIALQYGIASLLRRNNANSIEQFFRANPTHWITHFSDSTVSVVLMQLTFSQDSAPSSEDDLPALIYGLQNIIEELLEPNYHCASFRHSHNTLGLVISPKDRDHNRELLFTALSEAQNVMNEHFAMQLSTAVSVESGSLTELSALLQEAVDALSYTFLLGPSVITTARIVSNESNNQTVYSSDLDQRLEDAITRQDMEECKRTLHEIKAVLKQLNIRNAIICTTSLLNQVHSILSKNAKSSASVSFPLHAIYGYISESGTIDQCFDAILNHIHVYLCEQPYESKTNNELFINSIFDFIQNSYFDTNLSSQMIAEYFGLSNRYLMKKFKTLTGVSLNEYITDLRLKMAAALLRDTDSSISSIADQVGIDNLSYFYRLFKKNYGCTPKEFRDNEETVEETG